MTKIKRTNRRQIILRTNQRHIFFRTNGINLVNYKKTFNLEISAKKNYTTWQKQ
jgi:hypothetical protein